MHGPIYQQDPTNCMSYKAHSLDVFSKQLSQFWDTDHSRTRMSHVLLPRIKRQNEVSQWLLVRYWCLQQRLPRTSFPSLPSPTLATTGCYRPRVPVSYINCSLVPASILHLSVLLCCWDDEWMTAAVASLRSWLMPKLSLISQKYS